MDGKIEILGRDVTGTDRYRIGGKNGVQDKQKDRRPYQCDWPGNKLDSRPPEFTNASTASIYGWRSFVVGYCKFQWRVVIYCGDGGKRGNPGAGICL